MPVMFRAWPVRGFDKTESDRVFVDRKDNRDSCCRCLCRQHHLDTPERGDYGDLPANQLGRQCRQPIYLIFSEAVHDRRSGWSAASALAS